MVIRIFKISTKKIETSSPIPFYIRINKNLSYQVDILNTKFELPTAKTIDLDCSQDRVGLALLRSLIPISGKRDRPE